MPIVAIQRLTKRYGGGPPALSDVTFDVGEGVTGLLGPNGAGKSTLIQCVLGLLTGFQGDVRVLGLDVRRRPREVRRRVGFMPETDAYLARMTGIRAVRYLGQLTGMPYHHALRRAHEVLFHVGLGEAIYRPVAEYSTGMRQRFKLAQALVHDPELIFLDEPLAGLDPAGREELIGLIRDLARQHEKHVVWSSHILPDVQKVADTVAVLQKGTWRGTFAMRDLAPREGAFRVDAEGDVTALRERLEARGARVEADSATEDELAAHAAWTVTFPEAASADRLLAEAGATGVRVRRVEPLVEGLEEVFLRLLRDGSEAG